MAHYGRENSGIFHMSGMRNWMPNGMEPHRRPDMQSYGDFSDARSWISDDIEPDYPPPIRSYADQNNKMPNKLKASKKKKIRESKPSRLDKEVKKLRRLLTLYFHPAFKMDENTFTLHVFYCILFIINIAELSLITLQMFEFGSVRSHFSSTIQKDTITLRNTLLEGWDAEWETLPYPPAQGEFAVYDVEGIEKKIKHVILKEYDLSFESLGYYNSYGYPINMTYKYYSFNWDWDNPEADTTLATDEITFPLEWEYINFTEDYYSKAIDYQLRDALNEQGIYDWWEFLAATLSFNIQSMKFYTDVNKALCLKTLVKIHFKDLDKTGQVVVSMETETEKDKCEGFDEWSLQEVTAGIGLAVIIVCSIGLFFTLVTFVFGIFVLLRTKSFMRKYFKDYYQPTDPKETDLPSGEYFRFVSIWNICILLSEIFTLYGTAKIIFKDGESRSLGLDDLDIFTIFLGIGCFLAWLSVLRVVRCHQRFRLLLSTVWAASGDVGAYLLCVAILFIGYFVTGFVVLGPYNIKFSSPTYSLETLSALINGDEIFTTLNIMECEEYGVIWWFSRGYIWSYVAVFTIIVLNLFIAIFMSAYDIIKDKNCQRDGDAELGPLEKAMRNFIEIQTENEFRKALIDLMTSSHHFDSEEERELKTHLYNICQVSADGKNVVLTKPRTIKAFMREGKEAKSFTCCGVDFAFIFVSKHVVEEYVMDKN